MTNTYETPVAGIICLMYEQTVATLSNGVEISSPWTGNTEEEW